MRFSTLLSFLVAAVLAGLAVYGAQTWLDNERQQFSSIQQPAAVEKEEPKNTIVVANEPFTFGERLTAAKLREIEWSGNIEPTGSFKTIKELIKDESEEQARFALTSMETGEPILAGKVTDAGQRAKMSTALTPGMKAVSIRVNDVLGVAGFVLPGDRVDIMLTRGERSGKFVDVLLQGVRVLAIDQIADDRKDKPSVVRTVTFEVSTEEAQKLVLGATVGTLSLALRNVASTDVENLERITLQDLDDENIALEMARIKEEEARKRAEAEAARLAALKPEDDGSAERIKELEALLKNLSEGIENRFDTVEQKINKPEPVMVEPPKVEEKIVTVVPKKPKDTKVGVIRNGQRAEYKVRTKLDEANENAKEMILGQDVDEATANKLEEAEEDAGVTGVLISR